MSDKQARLTFDIDRQTHQHLKLVAVQQSTTIKALVSDAIKQHVFNENTSKRQAA